LPKHDNIIDEIILDLRSKDRESINRGIERIDGIFTEMHYHIGKKRPRRKIPINELLRKLLHLTSDKDWETRRLAERGPHQIQ